LFKELKRKRDHITHVRLEPNDIFVDISIDAPRPSIQVTDQTLFDAARVIYWVNGQLDQLFELLSFSKGYFETRFNDFLPFLMLFNALFQLAGEQPEGIRNEYSDWGQSQTMLELLSRHGRQ